MIPQSSLIAWSDTVEWPSMDQVEQDLLLSRLIVEIANDSYLGQELIFRGGTCLHKLHLPSSKRYSEDLDYVRRSGGGIGPVIEAGAAIGKRLGMKVNTEISQHPKIYLRSPFESGSAMMKIKV